MEIFSEIPYDIQEIVLKKYEKVYNENCKIVKLLVNDIFTRIRLLEEIMGPLMTKLKIYINEPENDTYYQELFNEERLKQMSTNDLFYIVDFLFMLNCPDDLDSRDIAILETETIDLMCQHYDVSEIDPTEELAEIIEDEGTYILDQCFRDASMELHCERMFPLIARFSPYRGKTDNKSKAEHQVWVEDKIFSINWKCADQSFFYEDIEGTIEVRWVIDPETFEIDILYL